MKKLLLSPVMFLLLCFSIVSYGFDRPVCPTLAEITDGGIDKFYMKYTSLGGELASVEYIKPIRAKDRQSWWTFVIYASQVRDEDHGWEVLKKLYMNLILPPTHAREVGKIWICDYSEGSFENGYLGGGGMYEIYATTVKY